MKITKEPLPLLRSIAFALEPSTSKSNIGILTSSWKNIKVSCLSTGFHPRNSSPTSFPNHWIPNCIIDMLRSSKDGTSNSFIRFTYFRTYTSNNERDCGIIYNILRICHMWSHPLLLINYLYIYKWGDIVGLVHGNDITVNPTSLWRSVTVQHSRRPPFNVVLTISPQQSTNKQ